MTDYEAWARHQAELQALEGIERAIREPAERARAQEEGRRADEHNDWMAAQDAKRTPEEREERRRFQAQQREWSADIARKDRAVAKRKRIRAATATLIMSSVGMAILVIGTIALWRYGMSKYDPNAAPSWGEAGRIVGALGIGFVTFLFAFYWLGTIWEVLKSLVSKG